MYVIIGILSGVIVILLSILAGYQRQVKDICRQLRFLKEHESNMRITNAVNLGNMRELTRLLNEQIQEQRKAQKEYLRKEQMIADTYTNLSHDIRTPLTSLDGYVQLLESADQEADRKRYLQIVQERIESLKEMLEELFTYTKLQNETYEISLSQVDLTRILKETLFSYYDDWKNRGIEPQIDITEAPLYVQGNAQALGRVIRNIIKNGLDHGDRNLKITLSKREHIAELTVQNSCAHAGDIDVERIFDRFYKADEARSKTSTGLGLSIAKGYVQKMGGEITAEVCADRFLVRIRIPIQFSEKLCYNKDIR